jgi:hypothetical protein
MGLRPNSLWAEYTGMPFVFSDQWLDDVQWCGHNAMFAADFDSLVGDWAAVGHSYYGLARILWDPVAANITTIKGEYYSAFGAGESAMRAYFTFWQQFTQSVYTNPAIVAQMAAYENKSSNLSV